MHHSILRSATDRAGRTGAGLLTYSELWAIQEPLILFVGVAQLWLSFGGRARVWRDKTTDWWAALEQIRWRDRLEVLTKFVALHEALYGERLLARRAFVVSCVVSLLFAVTLRMLLLSGSLLSSTSQ